MADSLSFSLELSRPAVGEARLRAQIDRAIGRALFDRDYADRLLREPTLAVEEGGCSPAQRLALQGIRASTLQEFAEACLATFRPSWKSATAAGGSTWSGAGRGDASVLGVAL